MKVYTKTGDAGTTALIGGERVSKSDPRVEAYGTVDELSAHVALLGDWMARRGGFEAEVEAIVEIQKDLMTVEAQLAGGTIDLPQGTLARLEGQIDRWTAELPAVRGFVLPGGDTIVSQSHVCRTVCRRAEREAVRAGGDGRYLNRLSDWLYTLGRRAVAKLNVKELYWIP